MNILIVDDEPLGRQRLRKLLEDSPHEILGDAEDGQGALAAIQRLLPDVVLLDIQMPDMTGLEVAARLGQLDLDPPPALIFCTAHDEHALEAFRVQALDYLLKPVRQSDLLTALDRVKQMNRAQLHQLQSPSITHLQARTHKGMVRVPVEDIRFFKADQKYVSLVYSLGEVVIDEPLKELESRLEPMFMRTHRGYLVNGQYVEAVERDEGSHFLKIKGIDERIPVSRRHWPNIKQWLKQMS